MKFAQIVIAVCLTMLAPDAQARSFRVDQVPNGSAYGCGLCHMNANGGGPRNGFGSQVENTLDGSGATAEVRWEAIFDQDGDADRYSNGRELGDPDGEWRIGDPDPSGQTYDPSDRTSSPCGDGVLENPPEECDGEEMIEVTCEELGWGPGPLACNSACRINESECEGYEPPFPTNNEANNSTNNANSSSTNASSNNATTGSTNGQTNGEMTGDEDVADEGCCAVLGPQREESLPFALLLGVVVVLRRRRGRG